MSTIWLRSQPEDYNNESVELKRNKIDKFGISYETEPCYGVLRRIE